MSTNARTTSTLDMLLARGIIVSYVRDPGPGQYIVMLPGYARSGPETVYLTPHQVAAMGLAVTIAAGLDHRPYVEALR